MSVDFKNCIILFGGSSEERLVSVASAQNLSVQIPEARLWYWSKDGKIYTTLQSELTQHQNPFTQEFKPAGAAEYETLDAALDANQEYFVIIALHGTEGEDGSLQKKLEARGMGFTGSGSSASALAFDKRATKLKAKEENLPVVEDLTLINFSLKDSEDLRNFFHRHGKIVLKPMANGSSVGLFIISNAIELEAAISSIQAKGIIPYLCEPFINGREITVGVWQRDRSELTVLPCSEVRIHQGGQFDYQGKYLGKGVEELTPAPLTEDESVACQALALRVHEILGCSGYSRTDMILTPDGPILLEINTLPGLTKASFIPQQLAVLGVGLREFFESQINQAQ